MRTKRCKLCGAIIYDEYSGDVCDVCIDEQLKDEEVNFFDSKVQKSVSEEVN